MLNGRLTDRESQTRGWAAPMPDFSTLPRANESARIRLEWETRDTMNNRLFSDIQVTGPKTVTSAMLASHPTAGAEPFMPSSGRQDQRDYANQSYFPSANKSASSIRLERPVLPGSYNPYMTPGSDQNTVRELQGCVTEDVRFRSEDAGNRIVERIFTHQWVPAEMTKTIVDQQLFVAERLRSRGDDYNTVYRNGS